MRKNSSAATNEPPPDASKRDLPEDRYKADLALLDRYQMFSAEILRLSLAGLAAVGFFLNIGEKAAGARVIAALLCNGVPKVLLIASIVLFALSSACALGHRGVSSDSLYYDLKIARGSIEAENFKQRQKLWDLSEWSLGAAPILLAFAVAAFGLAIIAALMKIG